jgi:hypothetical protein
MYDRITNTLHKRGLQWGLALFLIAVHFGLALSSARIKGPTADEYSYIASSYFYVNHWDFRLDRTHPPLLRLLIGLPLQGMDIDIPETDPDTWDSAESYRLAYPIGWEMLLRGGNDGHAILLAARLPILLLSCGLAGLLFLWAKSLYGSRGGFITLLFYCFSPTMLAHARLATMDAGLCFFFMLALFLLYRYRQAPSFSRLVLAGIGLGLALTAKVTALILLPVAVMAVVWKKRSHRNIAGKDIVIHGLKNSMVLLGIVFITLLAVYGYPLRPFYYGDTLANVFLKSLHTGISQANVAGMPHLHHAFYLMGHYSTQGWPYYFLVAFLVKTPLAVLLGLLLALGFRQIRWLGTNDGLLLASGSLLLLASMFNHVNIGIRHILPLYPVLFLYLGRLALLKPKGLQAVVVVLLGWFVLASAYIHPDYLAYFNEAAGGPRNGHTYLDDSNLDWGQDLPRLNDVQRHDPHEPLYIATNWMTNPAIYGIEATLLREDQIQNPPPGLVAVGKHWAIRNRINRYSSNYFDWLEKYPVIAEVGHSIWVFRIDPKPATQ